MLELLLTLAYTAFFIFLIGKMSFFTIEGFSKKNLQFVFILKVFSGFALSLIYTYYYTDRLTADTFKFYDDSKVIYDLYFTDRKIFWQFMFGLPHNNDTYMQYSNIMHNWWNKYSLYNESRTITRLNVLMRFFSMGYYQVHNVLFCFLSLTGLVAIAKLFSKDLKEFRKQIFILVFLFPSIVFWGSGVLKDGLIFFCAGMSLYFMERVYSNQHYKLLNLFTSILFLILLFFVKVHVFLIFFPCYVAYAWSTVNKKHIAGKFAITFFLFAVLLLSFHFINENINFLHYLVIKQQEFIKLATEVKAGSLINVNTLEPDIWSLIKNSPKAFFNTMFRPHLLDSSSPLILLSALENTFIIIFGIMILLSMDRKKTYISPMFCFSLFYVIALFTLVGLITPVMGAMVRYKVQGLPFLFFIFLFLTNKEKLVKRFSLLKPLMN